MRFGLPSEPGETLSPLDCCAGRNTDVSGKHGTLYIGVTSNLPQRVWQHRNDLVAGFSQRYQVHRLVWYEIHEAMESAFQREKRRRTGGEPGRSGSLKEPIQAGPTFTTTSLNDVIRHSLWPTVE